MLDCLILFLAHIHCCPFVLSKANDEVMIVVCGWWFSKAFKWGVFVCPLYIHLCLIWQIPLEANMTTIYCWPLELPVNERLQCKHLLPSLLSFVLITFWSIYACTNFLKLMQFFLNFLVELWLHIIYLKLTKTLQISCSVFF
jgi:hypothetical protein